MWRNGMARRGRAGSALFNRFEAESLEARRYFGVHTVNGTDGNDTIVVNHDGNNYRVTVNGSLQTFRGITTQIRGLDGDDTIIVNRTRDSAFIEVFGNSGDDTITIGGGNVEANIFSAHVEGDGGNDTVIVDDRNHVGFANYRLAVALPALVGIDLHFNESNRISLGDDVQVLRLLSPNNVTTTDIREAEPMQLDRLEIRGGTSTDKVNYVRSTGNAVLDFNGGGGDFDNIDYSDKNFGTSNRTATLEADRFLLDGTVRATFTNTDSLRLEIDGLNDTFNVNGVPAGASVRVDAGPGRDTYNIGGGDYDANIRGSILVFDPGNLDTRDERDTIAFHDTAGTTADTYHISGHIFHKGATPTTDPSDFQIFNPTGDDLFFNLNGGANTIHWDPSFSPRSVTINAGAGADTVHVGGGSLAGPDVILRGETGTDAVIFEDAGRDVTVSDKDYTFSGGFLRYLEDGFLRTTYDYDFESVTLDSGSFDSTFNVVSTGGENTLTLNGGDGADRLPFVPKATATNFVFNGQGGADAIEIDDTGDTIADTYTLTKTTFDKTGFSLLTFGTVETLLLRAHTAVNTFDVNGVAAGTAVTIVAGNSPDLFRVGAGDLDSNISGTLELVGEQGGDRVIFDDTLDTANDTYRLDNGVLTKANVPLQTMEYRFVEHVELDGSPGNNTFVVVSVGFALDLTLRGFNGADAFDITPSDRADILIEASDPTVPPGDSLRLVNPAAAGPATLVLNGAVNGTYTFAAAEPITFLGVETFPVPPAAPSVPDLAPGSDSGASDTDNITFVLIPILGGRAPAGSTVVLLDGGVEIASVGADSNGVYEFRPTPSEGVHAYTAAVIGSGQLRGAASAPLLVAFDRTAPGAPDAPDLATASDTGVSTADNLTRDNTPTFDGRAVTGTIVRLLSNDSILLGTATAAGSAYSITTSTLPDGVYSVNARLRDVAGNQSPAGPAIEVTVDTAAPAVQSAVFFSHPESRLAYTFSENVSGLEASFLTLVDLGTGIAIPEAALELVSGSRTGNFTFRVPGRVLPAGSYRATLSTRVGDTAGNDLADPHVFEFNHFAEAVGRRVFSNNSAFDGNNPAPTAADDGAVVADKQPLLPGQSATFANVTSYSKGLNGVMFDLSKLPAGTTPTAADFELHAVDAAGGLSPVGASAVLVRRGAGPSQSDRVTLTLPDGTARNAWLRVTVRANANTGLADPDVFFFGNLVGEAGGPGTPVVNSIDLARTRAAVGSTGRAARATFDFNRDGVINAADVMLVRNNQRRTLPPPVIAPAAAGESSASGAIRGDTQPTRRGVWDVLAADSPA